MALKVKKLAVEDDPPRENPAELAAKLSGAVAHLPTTRPPSSPPVAAPQPPVPPPAELAPSCGAAGVLGVLIGVALK